MMGAQSVIILVLLKWKLRSPLNCMYEMASCINLCGGKSPEACEHHKVKTKEERNKIYYFIYGSPGIFRIWNTSRLRKPNSGGGNKIWLSHDVIASRIYLFFSHISKRPFPISLRFNLFSQGSSKWIKLFCGI